MWQPDLCKDRTDCRFNTLLALGLEQCAAGIRYISVFLPRIHV